MINQKHSLLAQLMSSTCDIRNCTANWQRWTVGTIVYYYYLTMNLALVAASNSFLSSHAALVPDNQSHWWQGIVGVWFELEVTIHLADALSHKFSVIVVHRRYVNLIRNHHTLHIRRIQRRRHLWSFLLINIMEACKS